MLLVYVAYIGICGRAGVMIMKQHVRKGRVARKTRQLEAIERQAAYDLLSDKEKQDKSARWRKQNKKEKQA